MKNWKRTFKNLWRLWRALMLLGCVTMVWACSSDDDDIVKHNPYYKFSQLSFEEEYTTKMENGLNITRDESGRVEYIVLPEMEGDLAEKLKNAPTSFDDIKHLFPLSEGNEIRLIEEGQMGDYEEYPGYHQYYQRFQQYYKNVPIQAGIGYINYFANAEEKRMSYGWFGPFINVKDINPTPNISEKQARQKLADELNEERNDNWHCELQIREYSTRKEGKIQRDIRLIYAVTGPYLPSEPGVYYCMAPQYYAEIDAHTGQLLVISPNDNDL